MNWPSALEWSDYYVHVKPCVDCGEEFPFHHRKTIRCDACVQDAREWRREGVRRAAKSSWLKTKYGITPEMWQSMSDAQDGRCALCLEKPPRLVVDHDHGTGAVRGLLCGGCNTALGYFERTRSISGWDDRARTYTSPQRHLLTDSHIP